MSTGQSFLTTLTGLWWVDEEQNEEGWLCKGLGIHVTGCVLNPVFLAQELELEPLLIQWVCPSLHLFFSPDCPLDGAPVFQFGALGEGISDWPHLVLLHMQSKPHPK